MKKLVLTSVIMLLAFTFGCSHLSTKDTLVGKWQGVGDDQSVIEFFSDGTFSAKVKMKSSTVDINGNWSVLDDGRLKIDFIMMGQTISIMAEFSIDGDKMTTTDKNGKVSQSIRIK